MALNHPELLEYSPTRRPIVLQYTRKRHRSGCPVPPSQNDTPPNPKKPKTTRNLPNLAECHACGFRLDINKITHKRNRLELLFSEWRVVLLCKSCYNSVQNRKVCSYCFKGFKELGSGDGVLGCDRCRRGVHERCLFESRGFAPWSYCARERDSGFVCVDCWVPRNLRRGGHNNNYNNNRKKNEKKVVKRNSDVFQFVEKRDEGNNGNVLESVAERNEGNNGNVLESVAERNEGNITDAGLALELHRVMNSSRRISRNMSGDLGLPYASKGNGDASDNEDCEDAALDHDSSTDVDSLKESMMDGLPSEKNAVCVSVCDGEDENTQVLFNTRDDDCVDVQCQPCGERDKSVTQTRETSKEKPDRFLLKYTRRKSNLESSPCDKHKPLYNGVLGKFWSSVLQDCYDEAKL